MNSIFGIEYNKNFGQIYQINYGKEKRFIITAYDDKNKKNKMYCYGDNGNGKIYLLRIFNINSLNINDIRINDNNFLVEQENYGGKVYNIELDKKSKFFDIIFEYENNGKLFVSENVVDNRIGKINDVISYGIDLSTLKIVTPIWSNLQQRSINLYNEIDINNKKIEYSNSSYYTYCTDDIETTTINFEVQKYLDIIADHYNQVGDCNITSLLYDIDEKTFKEYKKRT